MFISSVFLLFVIFFPVFRSFLPDRDRRRERDRRDRRDDRDKDRRGRTRERNRRESVGRRDNDHNDRRRDVEVPVAVEERLDIICFSAYLCTRLDLSFEIVVKRCKNIADRQPRLYFILHQFCGRRNSRRNCCQRETNWGRTPKFWGSGRWGSRRRKVSKYGV